MHVRNNLNGPRWFCHYFRISRFEGCGLQDLIHSKEIIAKQILSKSVTNSFQAFWISNNDCQAKSMLMTDVENKMSSGEKFKMLMTVFAICQLHHSCQIVGYSVVGDFMMIRVWLNWWQNLSTTSLNCHQHKKSQISVTSIDVVLSPWKWKSTKLILFIRNVRETAKFVRF